MDRCNSQLFICSECNQIFHVADDGISESMVNWSLATGDGVICPDCDEGLCALWSAETPLSLYSFKKEETDV